MKWGKKLKVLGRCQNCAFYSPRHGACFHPDSWTQGELFKVPGDPLLLNPDGVCRNFEVDLIHPVGLWDRVKRFFRTIFIFKVVK